MALGYESKLDEISKQLKEGVKPQPVTARTFIGWFGAQRRSFWNVINIRGSLEKFQLKTEPDFEYAYIDSSISFVRAPKKKAGQVEEEVIPDVYKDPTYRIGKLASANRGPLSVNPDDTISRAVVLMTAHDYSQLPVMTSDREVKGVVSWASVGQRLALGKKDCESVRDCMVPHKEISSETSIFDAVDDIIANQYVLVRNAEKVICGIVTTSDLSQEFGRLGEPFLLLGEIENHIRRMIKDNYTIGELKEACDPSDATRNIRSPADLTLGEYLHLVENPERWTKLGVTVDRETFVNELQEIRRIRNDVMHFDPDGISEEDLGRLRDFVRLMQSLARAGGI